MAQTYTSPLHIFSIDDLTGTFSGETYAENPAFIDTTGSVVPQFSDKDGNVLSAVDSEFGFYVTDFIGAEQKVIDGDYGEGFIGNIYDETDPTAVTGIAVKNAVTDVFRSALPLGTWALGLGGQTVKASTEHYVTMADVLSDQRYAEDPDAIAPLDNDLKLLDLRPTGADGAYEPGVKHELYVEELSEALQWAIDNVPAGNPQDYDDHLDFDRDGTNDPFRTVNVVLDLDTDGDGVLEAVTVGGVDLDKDGEADIVDSILNGLGGEADVVDLLEPNEANVTFDIAYSSDYSVTLKDDGKLLYRWGTAVKRPNDIRLEVNLELPEEWTRDEDDNGVADILENGSDGFVVTRAELVINHDITNNPNDQVRPEDYENEAAIGRLPSHYIVKDPDDPTNTLWVSPVDSFDGEGDPLPSYFKLTDTGEIDLGAGGIPVYDLADNLVGYRNVDGNGDPIGTVLRDLSLIALNEAADLDFSTADLEEGFTPAWYTTVDREPFEWSYDVYPDDPNAQVFVSFRTPEEAAAEGYTEDALVSGPRWRLTPNKFGQDLPGLEVPLEPNSQPPYQRDNIKYPTGEPIVTTLNLLDWEDEDGDGEPDSPLAHSDGWMMVDPGRLDENADGVIDEGWSNVNGSLGAGDALPTGPILSAVTPNGLNLTQNFFDTSVYVKGDRQDSAKLYDMQLVIEYGSEDLIGAVQRIDALDHDTQTVAYKDGATFDAPVVFVTPPTFDGGQPASVTVQDVGAASADVAIEEPEHYDGWHLPEEVTMLTLEEGTFTLGDGSKLEVGTVDLSAGSTNRFTSVSFGEAFDETPVVLVQLQTDNGDDWAVLRTRNVTTTGFEVAVQEQEASDGLHDAEVVGYAAIDAAAATGVIDWDGLAAQALTEEDAASSTPGWIDLDSAVGTDPLISAIVSSFNGANPATLRLTDLVDDGTSASAEFFVQEEQSLDQETFHLPEDISLLAFEDEGLLYGVGATTVDALTLA